MEKSKIKIFNKTEYKQHRQELRHNMTEPEQRLWQILSNNPQLEAT